MPLVTVVGVLIVGGVILWFIKETLKKFLNAVVVIFVVIWLLRVFGFLTSFSNLTLPKLN